jgi:cyclopropane-fatty-acyl-phospholipid synthase
MQLLDYRELPEDEPFDKIASVGMFEHVGRRNCRSTSQDPSPAAPGRPAAEPRHHRRRHAQRPQLGAGMGDFIERYIFPGGELLHVSQVLRSMAEQGLEGLDTENLRPHYARTLWAWSDALEAQLDAAARSIAGERVVRAFRLYLAGSAMCFEQRLDGAAPDARVAARAAARPAARCAEHNRTTRSTARTSTNRTHDLQVQSQGRGRPDHAGPVG